MKILVTGGAGFIGSNLALALQLKGHQVVVLDNFSSGHFKLLGSFRGDVMARDIVDSLLQEQVGDIEVIFHQAAITDTTVTDQRRMIQCNVEGFRNVLQWAARRRIPLIYASSAGVYGSGKTPMKENQTPQPLNSYAFSKSVMDSLAKEAIQRKEIPLLVGLRYFNVFGPGEQFKGTSASMIYQLAEQMKQKKRPRIFIDGEQRRDHIYVKDVVEANLKALQAHRSGIVNVGTGVATTFNRLIEVLNEVLQLDLEPDYFENPYVGAYQDETVADTRAACELIGFKARYSIEEGIREYFSLGHPSPAVSHQ